MAKLTGAAKTAFLKRINKGRAKAGLKRIKSKFSRKSSKKAPSVRRKPSKVNKKRTTKNSVAKKKGGGKKRESKGMRIAKRAGFGALLGLAGWAVSRLVGVDEELSGTVGDVAASFQGPEGVITAVVARKVLPMVAQGNGFLQNVSFGGSQQASVSRV